MSLPLTRARRARIEPRASYVAMASLTGYFKTVTATEHLTTAFSPQEPGRQYSESTLVARVVFLVLELITEVRVPYGLVDVVASYYAQEPVNRHIGFGRRSGRHLRKRSQ